MEHQDLNSLVKGHEFAERLGIGKQLFYKWCLEQSAPPPSIVIASIQYWRIDVVQGFCNAIVQKDTDGNWIITDTGDLIPYSLQKSYGYTPNLQAAKGVYSARLQVFLQRF
jgi:hypothetical protein